MGEAIVGIIKSLPEIMQFANKLMSALEGLAKMAKDQQVNSWLDSLNKATSDLKNAQTLRDRINAAQRLNDLSRGM